MKRYDRGLVLLFAVLYAVGCEGPPTASPHAYTGPAPARCPVDLAAVPVDGELVTAAGLHVRVRAPANHRPTAPHPLLVVYAAAGMTPSASERWTGFTPVATAAGWLVAYAQHVRPSRAALRRLGAVPATVAAHYCVDPARVVVAGHSDGGTTATALSVEGTLAPRALVASAAGFRGEDLAGFACPAPLPVLVHHGARDRLFPGWGRETAAWWAGCNGCAPAAAQPLPGTCLHYAGCAAPVHYCEGDHGHATWPPSAAGDILDFLTRNVP